MTLPQSFSFVCTLWVIAEVAMILKARGIRSQDQSSLGVIWLAVTAGISVGVAIQKSGWGDWGEFRQSLLWCGLVLVLVGIIIRIVAIVTLRRFFTVQVSILSDHRLIRHGLYARIRHPAYLGALVAFLGVGVGMVNWLSLIVVFVPIFAAFLHRMNIEEQVLKKRFGADYEKYCSESKRLLPGVY